MLIQSIVSKIQIVNNKFFLIKFFLTIELLCIGINFSYSQCGISELFPVKHGMTKFQVLNVLNSQKNITGIIEFLHSWDKIDYLKNDSVFKNQINFNYVGHNCCNGYKNIILLSFVDDKLYEMSIKIFFEAKDFPTCIDNYNNIFKSLKTKFPYYKEIISQVSSTSEQIGEGYWLSVSKSHMDKQKLEKIELRYSIDHTVKFNGTAIANDKQIYILELSYVNLENTKLTREGY